MDLLMLRGVNIILTHITLSVINNLRWGNSRLIVR